MPKITYVPCFVPIDTELGEYFTKLAVCYSNQHYFGLNKQVRWIKKMFLFYQDNSDLNKKNASFVKYSPSSVSIGQTQNNVILEIDF